jgi:hypothetical protein
MPRTASHKSWDRKVKRDSVKILGRGKKRQKKTKMWG